MSKENFPLFLALIVASAYLALLTLTAFHEVPANSHDSVQSGINTLSNAFIAIVSYYFGSSAGSAKKTDLLAPKDDITAEIKP